MPNHFGPLGGLMDIQNHQIVMRILTLHAPIGLQNKFEENWTKYGIFSLQARQPAWAHPMDQ